MRALIVLIAFSLLACTPSALAPGASASSSTSPATSTVTPSPTLAVTATPTATPATSATPISLPTTAQLAAAGIGVVWALVADSRLFRSTDRGATWAERSLPAGLSGTLPNPMIAFVSDADGWLALAGSPATQCQIQSVDIYRTRDGAATWQKLAPTGIADAQCKGWIGFSDQQHGYLSTWDQNAPPRVFATADGGSTWKSSQPIPDPPGFTTIGAGVTLRANAVADFVAVMFLDAFGFSGGRQVDYVFRSTDRGANWSYVTTAPQSVSVVFVTTTRWLQIGAPGQSSETTDAGATWHAFATDYQQAAPINPVIVFGDANVGYATVRGAIQRTVDGGAHWITIKTPGT